MITKWFYLLLGVSVLADINLNKGPVMIPSKEEVVLQNGQNYTILCKGHRPLHFKKEELYEDATFSNFTKTERILISDDSSHDYTIAYDLNNIDEYAVGYYACFDDTVNAYFVLNDVDQEPINTPHISYIYVYVNGTEKIFVPMSDIVKVEGDSDETVIKCRPTVPDVNLTLVLESSDFPATDINPIHIPKVGYVLNSEDLSYFSIVTCIPSGYPRSDAKLVTVYKPHQAAAAKNPLKLDIFDNTNFKDGDNFTFICRINKNEITLPYHILWEWPNQNRSPTFRDDHNTTIYYNKITITKAVREDAGYYTCKDNLNHTRSSRPTMYREPGFLQFDERHHGKTKTYMVSAKRISFNQQLQFVYPEPEISYYLDGNLLTIDNRLYSTTKTFDSPSLELSLIIHNITMDDSGNYTCVASNPYRTVSFWQIFQIKDGPYITFNISDKELIEGQKITLPCSVKSVPIKLVEWYIDGAPAQESLIIKSYNNKVKHTHESVLEIQVHKNTNITCSAGGRQNKTRKLIVYELNSSGFGIKEKKSDDPFWFPENTNTTFTCVASKNKYTNCTWLNITGNRLSPIVKYATGTLSYKAKLQFRNIGLHEAGSYQCVAFDSESNIASRDNITLQVAETKPINITNPKNDQNVYISTYNNIKLSCEAEGVPPPTVTWKKDGKPLLNMSKTSIKTSRLDRSSVQSTVVIEQVSKKTLGKYECEMNNAQETVHRTFTVEFTKDSSSYIAILSSVLIALLLLVLCLIFKMWNDKKKLRKMGMEYFKQGRKLNPNLGLDEQADMLPYDERFEFPRKKLTLGEVLGSGAFGTVHKATAQGIINAERTDIVAVKMVKKDAELTHMVALASELKIMIHLGKHVNIVNLLGACTKNIVKSELLVIVEYCEFGNLHNYVRRHREVFIDQLTDNNVKYGKVNRGYTCSNNSNSGLPADYFCESNMTQNTDHTFLNTGNSNRTSRLASDRSSKTDRRSESNEYSDGRQLRPLCSRDLLAWSFQIARGMEYLASRKVFHGDLAARNILLANDNVVKICDFGLARSMYKNEEYLKQENSLLPVKWLAIECMTERVFSTQSDVWAFGIVLWELFSLAMSPYPNINHSDLLEWLQQGNRLEKPAHADDRLYDVMLRCWQYKPQARPSFSTLEETLGSFLDDNVRNHYVDLNDEYNNFNMNHGGEDYLAMIAAPDYNIATPNPNEYVNVENERRFFPRTPLPEDASGYLQVTPKCASPRNKFEFGSRRSETESHELTPMLSTNNLPSRSISESDQEGNISPYPKTCTRINEEGNDMDDVFENNENNIKNTVTNLLYITTTADVEKKPVNKNKPIYEKEILNNYMNVSNRLVK